MDWSLTACYTGLSSSRKTNSLVCMWTHHLSTPPQFCNVRRGFEKLQQTASWDFQMAHKTWNGSFKWNWRGHLTHWNKSYPNPWLVIRFIFQGKEIQVEWSDCFYNFIPNGIQWGLKSEKFRSVLMARKTWNKNMMYIHSLLYDGLQELVISVVAAHTHHRGVVHLHHAGQIPVAGQGTVRTQHVCGNDNPAIKFQPEDWRASYSRLSENI